jgi:hypothetical protein
MTSRAWLLLSLVACGSRTGLDPLESSGTATAAPASSASSAGSTPTSTTSASSGTTTATGSTTSITSATSSASLPRDAGRDAPPPCTRPPWLLFELTEGESTHLYAVRADGSDGHVTPVAPNGTSVSFSPDGTQVFYETFTDPDDAGFVQSLIVEDLGTGATRVLVSGPAIDSFPGYNLLSYSALAPDGHTLAYTYGYDVHLIDIDGSNDRVLLQAPSDGSVVYGHPSFTSDSQTVLYGSAGDFGSIGVDGTGMTTLVSQTGLGPLFPNVTPSPEGASVAAVMGCAGMDAAAESTALRVYPLASLPAPCESGTVVTYLPNRFAAPNESSNPSWGPSGLIAYGAGVDVYVVDPAGGA